MGPKLGSFLVQFFFDDYSFFMKKAIFFFVLHEELKTKENATSIWHPKNKGHMYFEGRCDLTK